MRRSFPIWAASAALFLCQAAANAIEFGATVRQGGITVTPVKVQANLILSGVTNHEAVAVVLEEAGSINRRYKVTIEYPGGFQTAMIRGVGKDGGSSAVAWFDFPSAPKVIDKITVVSEGEEVFQ